MRQAQNRLIINEMKSTHAGKGFGWQQWGCPTPTIPTVPLAAIGCLVRSQPSPPPPPSPLLVVVAVAGHHGHVVPPQSLLWPCPVIFVAMWWPLILVVVWCPPGHPHGCWCPHSSSSPWVPQLSWLYMVPPHSSSSPWVPPTDHGGCFVVVMVVMVMKWTSCQKRGYILY